MAALDRHRQEGPEGRRRTAPGRATVVARDAWKLAVQHLVDAARDNARPVGRQGRGASRAASRSRPARSASSRSNVRDGKFPSVAARHPAAIRLERAIADLYGLKPVGAPDTQALARSRLLGRDPSARQGEEIAASRRALTSFCRSRERTCIRSRSARSMPASSSPGISASPPMARPWCGSNSGSAMCIRASKLLMAGASIDTGAKLAGRTSGDSTVAYALAFAQAVEGGASDRCAAARGLAPRADGRARAHGQSFRRYRRHLQRCVVLLDLCRMRHPARAHLARGASRVRPSIDDGPHRAGRRRRRHRSRRRGAHCASCSRPCAAASPSSSRSTTTPPRFRTAPSPPAISRRPSRALSAPAAMSAAPRAAPSTRARRLRYAPYDRARVRGAGARRR